MNNDPFPFYEGELPSLSTQQMIEVDRLMIEEYQVELIQMMENAGRCLALLAKRKFLANYRVPKKVVVLAGTGGNGGGAMVCARRLATWGVEIAVFVTHPDRMSPAAHRQLSILRNMEVAIGTADQLVDEPVPGLIVDGIIGYSLQGNPRGPALQMIQWANDQPTFRLSLDTPSGIDLTTGKIYEPTFEAHATLTLALPKIGLHEPAVKPYRGKLYLGDISVPPQLYSIPSLNMEVPVVFDNSDVVRID